MAVTATTRRICRKCGRNARDDGIWVETPNGAFCVDHGGRAAP